jgi:ferredoxin-nitrite reductase
MAAVRESAAEGWTAVQRAEPLVIGKLRLAGVYDDRQDGTFMLRVRIPRGRLTWRQAEALGEIALRFSRGPADAPGAARAAHGSAHGTGAWAAPGMLVPEHEAPRLAHGHAAEHEAPRQFLEITTRQDVQLHWVRYEDLPTIWERMEAVGLTSLQACGDTVRNLTGCAVAGLSRDEVLDVSAVFQRVSRWALETPTLTAFLPRKFKIALTGCSTDCILARINDLAFTPARRDGRAGFHVWAGGGLSDYPRLATSLDVFVQPGQVLDVVEACLRVYAELGDPEHKAVNRFRALVHTLGPDRLRSEVLARLAYPLPAAAEDLSTWRPADHVGVHPQIEPGLVYVGLNVPWGRLGGEELVEAARLARTYGSGEVRLTQRQNLVLSGVEAGRLPVLQAEWLVQRLRPEPDPVERAVVACTSAPFCKFGIVDAKRNGASLAAYLINNLSPAALARLESLRLHLSGCKASCAQVQVAQVGLRGAMAKDQAGYQEGFDVALGGDLAHGRLGCWVALELPATRAFQGVASLLESFAAEAGPTESLEAYLARQDTAHLRQHFALDARNSDEYAAELVGAAGPERS